MPVPHAPPPEPVPPPPPTVEPVLPPDPPLGPTPVGTAAPGSLPADLPEPDPLLAPPAIPTPSVLDPAAALTPPPSPAAPPSAAPAWPPDPPDPAAPPPAPTPPPVPIEVPPAPVRRSMLPGLDTPPDGVSANRKAPLLDYGAGEVTTGEVPIPVRHRGGPTTRRAPGRHSRRRAATAPGRAPRRTRAQGRAPEGAIVPLQVPLRSRMRALAVLSLVCIVGGVVAAGALVTVIVVATKALANL
jgi:hypothetical protein